MQTVPVAEQQLAIEIKIDRFRVVQFHQQEIPEDIRHDEVINFTHKFNVRVEDGIQSILTHLEIEIVRSSVGHQLATLTTEATFKLGAGYAKMKELGGIPRDLMLLAINLTYSTTRGIMIEKFAGTPLRNTYLPIINPSELLRQIEENARKVNVEKRSDSKE